MAYPEHYLLAFGGHQGDVLETWVCGIRLCEYGTGFIDIDQQDYLTNVGAPALAAWFARVDSGISSACLLLWAKFNKINGQGRYDDPATTYEHGYGTGVQGGSGVANLHPLQVTMVLSWRTNAAERGIGSHGRIYSPRPSVVVNTAGDIAGPQRVAAADSAALLLNTLDVTVGTGFLRPSIVSPGRGWPQQDNPGVANQIDTVIVDSSLDIQRRRSRSQSKEITSAVVAY